MKSGGLVFKAALLDGYCHPIQVSVFSLDTLYLLLADELMLLTGRTSH